MADFPLLNEASLVMIPGATKEGKVYSQVPTDGSGDFTFTRSTSATRVNEAGNIEKGYENLLLQSNSFDTTWVNYLTTETSGQTGYDGSSDAWLLTKSGANGTIYQNKSSSGVQTVSVYAKKNTNSWLQIYAVGSPNVRAYYDLENGVLGGYFFNAIEREIEDVGNGWYRCSVTFNSSLNSVRLYPSDGNNDESGTSGSIYIQDAQLNQGLVAYPYLETTTVPVYGGLQADQPRLDYTDATCPSLLLEPSRTNELQHSEYVLDWAQNTADITLSDNLSPEGYKNCWRVEGTASGSQVGVATFGRTQGTTYTTSIWIRKVSGSDTALFKDVNNNSTTIDITTEWERYTITSTTSTTTARLYIQVQNTGDVIEVYGAQLEASSYPTSYIPTYGSAVTRSRELVDNQSLESVLGDSDLTILYDFDYDVVGREGSGQLFLTFSGADSLGIKGTRPTNRSLQIFSNGGFGNNITFNNSSPYATHHKVLLRVTSDIVELFYNGVKHNDTINTDGIVGSYSWDRIKIDSIDAFSAGTNQVVAFSTALTDSECIALTTL